MGYVVCFGGAQLDLTKTARGIKLEGEALVSSYATYLCSLKGGDKSVGEGVSQLSYQQFLHSHHSLDSSSRSQSESSKFELIYFYSRVHLHV